MSTFSNIKHHNVCVCVCGCACVHVKERVREKEAERARCKVHVLRQDQFSYCVVQTCPKPSGEVRGKVKPECPRL